MFAIIKGVLGLGTTYLEGRQQKAKAKANLESKLIEQDGSWENLHAKGSHHSWKDEFWTIIFAIPMVLAFIPSMEQHVTAGFAALSNTPEWYRWSVASLVAASVGIKQVKNFLIK